jgi:manganese/iron transport system permease protein
MTIAPTAPYVLAAGFFPEALTTCSVAVACAVLSVFVVSRRWAFIGEGISHSGFGGAGTVWLLALAFPALDAPAAVYAGVVLFCLAAGWGIAFFSRARGAGPGGTATSGAANTDAVIGIFLVASVAWGFLAQYCYARAHGGRSPTGFEEYLFGRPAGLTMQFALVAAFLCAVVVAVVAVLAKEIVYYCFDPAMAEASGVHAGFVHYLLILLVTLTIVVGARIAGSILVTALLVLPGATALLLSDRLRTAVAASVALGLAGAAGGLLVHWRWSFLPTGPAVVLAMFAGFVLVSAWTRVRARSAA